MVDECTRLLCAAHPKVQYCQLYFGMWTVRTCKIDSLLEVLPQLNPLLMIQQLLQPVFELLISLREFKKLLTPSLTGLKKMD